MLAVGFDLAQAHQQVVPVPGEPQGGFALGIGLAYPFHLHRIELAVAGGHPLVAGNAELVLLHLIPIDHQIAHLGLAGHEVALQCQLIGGLVQQTRLGRQGELFLLVHAADFTGGPVKGLDGLAAAPQSLALVAVLQGHDLVAFQRQGALFGQPGNEHAGTEFQIPGAVAVLLQAVNRFAVDRNALHVRCVTGGERGKRLGEGQAAADGQGSGHQPAKGVKLVSHCGVLACLFRIGPAVSRWALAGRHPGMPVHQSDALDP